MQENDAQILVPNTVDLFNTRVIPFSREFSIECTVFGCYEDWYFDAFSISSVTWTCETLLLLDEPGKKSCTLILFKAGYECYIAKLLCYHSLATIGILTGSPLIKHFRILLGLLLHSSLCLWLLLADNFTSSTSVFAFSAN